MNPEFAKCISTFFYVGYAPLVPGSLASLVGLIMAWFMRGLLAVYIPVAVLVTILGFWVCGEAEKAFGKKDPGCVVIDEVSGMLISMFMIPLTMSTMITGFFLFRAFDMFKVPPADRFEKLHGSRGIMLDDIMAGVYTNLVLQVAIRVAGVY
ncbi:MAG: phosphatidylglycerophosphatase A [Candidatus Omnitrophica bacterium]|nr:phosphatidylglycerophosphatase A [Candidatus Omnitrophota bacterium]